MALAVFVLNRLRAGVALSFGGQCPRPQHASTIRRSPPAHVTRSACEACSSMASPHLSPLGPFCCVCKGVPRALLLEPRAQNPATPVVPEAPCAGCSDGSAPGAPRLHCTACKVWENAVAIARRPEPGTFGQGQSWALLDYLTHISLSPTVDDSDAEEEDESAEYIKGLRPIPGSAGASGSGVLPG